MKLRGLILAASCHAGAIALACAVVSAGPAGVAPAVTTQAEVTQPVVAPGEVEPMATEFIRTPTDDTPQIDADPAAFNTDDVMPHFEPEPEPVVPTPLQPPREAAPFAPRQQHQPLLQRPVAKPVQPENKQPEPIASSPVKVKEVVSRPDIWLAPRLTKWSAPAEVRNNFEGHVLAVISIDENGHVLSVSLERGTGKDWLDKQLRKSFREAEYKPATRNGKPVASELRQPVDFE
ncbi:MAG: TonB family protein [Planctomycetes bacterium]|nr:TonB family protein [Planctomycetota bacterium]